MGSPRAWILPVGLEFDRALKSLQIGGERFYVIYGKTQGSGDWVNNQARKFAENLDQYLRKGPFETTEMVSVDVLSIREVVRTFRRIVDQELGRGARVFINIGTSSKVIAVAAVYVASRHPEQVQLFYPKAQTYLLYELLEWSERVAENPTDENIQLLKKVLSAYRDHGWTEGPYDMVRIPVIPFQKLSELQRNVLSALAEREFFDSISELTEYLEDLGRIQASTKEGALSSVSFVLPELSRLNLVETEKHGKTVTVAITDAGLTYVDAILSSYEPNGSDAPDDNQTPPPQPHGAASKLTRQH